MMLAAALLLLLMYLAATSTIATVLYNGAKSIIPVDSVAECIKLGKQMEVITAGERDGKIAEGLNMETLHLLIRENLLKGKF